MRCLIHGTVADSHGYVATRVIAVVFNPTARGEKARAFHNAVRDLPGNPRLLPTRGPGDAIQLATDAAREGAEVVVAAGGDGTLNEVVNGLAALPVHQRPALGVLPLGTVNVFALELGIPTQLDSAWHIIRTAQSRRIDLGLATHAAGRRYFAQMAGAGLDAIAITRINWNLKKVIGPLAYLWAGLGALVSGIAPITVTGGPAPVPGRLALLGNGRLYGGPFPVFPRAAPDDGRLDLALLNRIHPLALLRAAVAARRGRLLELPTVVLQQSPEFHLNCATASMPFEVEGDPIGNLPASFTVEPKALRVMVPTT